jgi:ArsR family transcriptional regulator, lead/cadmium/zinc/bismuth-responsive transcriptional repressor
MTVAHDHPVDGHPVDGHPVDDRSVARARASVLVESEAKRLSDLLGLLADPVRVRVLFALVPVDELCVGDLALVLDISLDQSSYALKLLRAAGLVQSRRAGRVIYYRLADGFPHQLLEHCLHELLTISGTKELS